MSQQKSIVREPPTMQQLINECYSRKVQCEPKPCGIKTEMKEMVLLLQT